MKIEELFEQNEHFKQKWLQLSDDDLFTWLQLQDEMITQSSNMKSEYYENKLRLDVEKWKRMIELKAELDENWKKKYTESTADWQIKQEFLDKDIRQLELKTMYELLFQKAQTINEYINIVKMNKKWAYSI
jgi:hypothetical protein